MPLPLEYRLPVHFLAHPGGAVPVFRDARGRHWFLLFRTEDRAAAWLPRAVGGTLLLTAGEMAPLMRFARKNRGAGFAVDPEPDGRCAGVIPAAQEEGKSVAWRAGTLAVAPRDGDPAEAPTLVINHVGAGQVEEVSVILDSPSVSLRGDRPRRPAAPPRPPSTVTAPVPPVAEVDADSDPSSDAPLPGLRKSPAARPRARSGATGPAAPAEGEGSLPDAADSFPRKDDDDAAGVRADSVRPEPSLIDAADDRPAGPASPDARGTGHSADTEPRTGDDDEPDATPRLPGYEILKELGRGGMGVVYLARQVGLERLAAVKMVLGGAKPRGEELVRFRIEAEAVARLNHPNIVAVYEVGQHRGRPYFTLEYVAGGSLSQLIAKGPLPVDRAARLAELLARAMHEAHARNIVHRDLKPANVLLAEDGTPKIADFGLAKQMDTLESPTTDAAVLGTPNYMSPEQAQGENDAVGPRSDVFALGGILYAMLAGRAPFTGDSPLQVLYHVTHSDPKRPSEVRRKGAGRIPPDLEVVCLKCLEKDPARRYQSAHELAEDLRRFREGMGITARPAGPIEKLTRWARRNPLPAALSALLVLGFLIGFATVAALWKVAQDEREEAVTARASAETAEKRAVAEAAEKERQREAAEQARRDAEEAGNRAREEARLKEEQRKAADQARAKAGMALDFARMRLMQAILALRLGPERVLAKLSADDPAQAAVRHELAGESLEIMRGLVMELGADDEFRTELFTARIWVAQMLFTLGRPEEAAADFKAVQADARKVLAERPGRNDLRWTSAAMDQQLAKIAAQQGRVEESRTLRAKAVAELADLLARHPDADEIRRVIMDGLDDWAGFCLQHGPKEEAEQHARESLRLAAEQVRLRAGVPMSPDPRVPPPALLHAEKQRKLAEVLLKLGRVEEAEREFRTAVDLAVDAAGRLKSAQARELAATHHVMLGGLHLAMKRPADAEGDLTAGMALLRELMARPPTTAKHRRDWAAAVHNRATARFAQGKADEGFADIGQSAEAYRTLVAENPANVQWRWELAETVREAGGILAAAGRAADARKLHAEARGHYLFLTQARPAEQRFRTALERLGDLPGDPPAP